MSRSDNNCQTGLRLILETDAIISPLTGIGRYALELLRGFNESQEIAQLRCIDRGRWRAPQSIVSSFSGDANPSLPAPQRWYSNPFKATLRKLLPYAQGALLRPYRDYIYHSPNYRLMPFPGKKIVTIHDLSILRYPRFHPQERLDVLTPALEHAARQADHIITDTETVRQEVIAEFGLSPGNVTAVHLASSLSPEHINIRSRDRTLSRLGLTPGQYLLFASTLEPRKNVTGLLRAYSELPALTRSHFPLVLAGQMGWQSGEIARELETAQGRGNVIHTGYLSNTELASLYSGARALVYPSLYEGFGLPPLEAQGFGVPVITSDCSCMPEVMGDSALLVDPLAQDAIGEAMLKLIDDDATHRQLADASRTNAARYSWRQTVQDTIAVYEKLG